MRNLWSRGSAILIPTASLPAAATLCSWTRHFAHDCPSPTRSAKRGEYGTPPGRQSYPGRGSSIKERSINTTLRWDYKLHQTSITWTAKKLTSPINAWPLWAFIIIKAFVHVHLLFWRLISVVTLDITVWVKTLHRAYWVLEIGPENRSGVHYINDAGRGESICCVSNLGVLPRRQRSEFADRGGCNIFVLFLVICLGP